MLRRNASPPPANHEQGGAAHCVQYGSMKSFPWPLANYSGHPSRQSGNPAGISSRTRRARVTHADMCWFFGLIWYKSSSLHENTHVTASKKLVGGLTLQSDKVAMFGSDSVLINAGISSCICRRRPKYHPTHIQTLAPSLDGKGFWCRSTAPIL